MTNLSQNPLLSLSEHPHEAFDFNQLKNEHFMAALETAITKAKSRIDGIVTNTEAPDFSNTIVALETCSEEVDIVATVFFNLLSAHTNDEMQELAKEISPKLSNFSNDILLNQQLFEKVRKVYNDTDTSTLGTEDAKLLEDSFTQFSRNGALLNDEQKESLRGLDEKLAELTPVFNENTLKATNAFELVIENQSDLSGLPESVVEAAREAAKAKGLEGEVWLFNLQFPSFGPFMKYADNRELRQKMYLAYTSRAFKDEFDNQEVVQKIAQLRHERANLLGYKTHADFVLEKRMAETPRKVNDFINKLVRASKPAAQKELDELQEFMKTLGQTDPIMPWDFSYYSEKLKEKKFSYNDEDLRPYFELDRVVNGVFKHAQLLFGLEFKLNDQYPVYHEDVKVYEVTDAKTGEFLSLFYTDFFPRESKQNGAWMTNYRNQGLFFGEVRRPHVGIVCNFSKPTSSKPSLLTFNEVATLFHEFGHALHGMLSKCTYPSLGGTNVYWDFVELPSQVMENWILEKESLDLFAKHFETGESIPAELAQKIKDSSKFMAGYNSIRQLNFCRLDMAWHGADPSGINDVAEFEKKVTEETQILPKIEGTNTSCAFGHIFGGGYSAGYYSYKWAEVLDADAFELFKEKGLFDAESAQSFRENILEKGGSEHPMTLYKRFRGREPDPDALLRRDGLI